MKLQGSGVTQCETCMRSRQIIFERGGLNKEPKEQRTRINRKEQPTTHTTQLSIEVLPPDARLDHNVHVVLVELDDAVHVGEVDADAAVRGGEVALEARAARVRDDGDAVAVADARDGRDLLRRPRVRHRHRQVVRVRRRPLRVPVRVQVVRVRADDVLVLAVRLDLPTDLLYCLIHKNENLVHF